FFSSRRRHTSWPRDWSSDVCSSDLKVVVIGDHEQVSPYAVGFETNRVQALVDEFLDGVPNKQLYDGKTSVYDLARQAFGGVVRLVEHFRCVPEIIEFSNQLCYGGEILPLRE